MFSQLRTATIVVSRNVMTLPIRSMLALMGPSEIGNFTSTLQREVPILSAA